MKTPLSGVLTVEVFILAPDSINLITRLREARVSPQMTWMNCRSISPWRNNILTCLILDKGSIDKVVFLYDLVIAA